MHMPPLSIHTAGRVYSHSECENANLATCKMRKIGKTTVSDRHLPIEAGCDIKWRREAGTKGAYAPGGTFQRQHFKEDKKNSACVRPFKCFVALDIRHQRCSVTFKMHQIHFRPGLCQRRTLGSSPHSLVGWELRRKEGRQDEHLPRAPQSFAPPLVI